ncbi:unnamed protein product, partial [Brenthis ino]
MALSIDEDFSRRSDAKTIEQSSLPGKKAGCHQTQHHEVVLYPIHNYFEVALLTPMEARRLTVILYRGGYPLH